VVLSGGGPPPQSVEVSLEPVFFQKYGVGEQILCRARKKSGRKHTHYFKGGEIFSAQQSVGGSINPRCALCAAQRRRVWVGITHQA